MILLLPVDVTLYFMPTSFGGFCRECENGRSFLRRWELVIPVFK
jgi:hypothetical protein